MVDSTVRAMTWNVWWRFGPRWQDRQPGLRATLRRLRPDVVALQEVWAGDGTTQADELAGALGMHAVFASPSYPPAPAGPEADWAGIDLGIAVLSRWPVLDHEAPVMPARHRSWDPVALSVRVAHPAGTGWVEESRTVRGCGVGGWRRRGRISGECRGGRASRRKRSPFRVRTGRPATPRRTRSPSPCSAGWRRSARRPSWPAGERPARVRPRGPRPRDRDLRRSRPR